jgi:hypothetical protein
VLRTTRVNRRGANRADSGATHFVLSPQMAESPPTQQPRPPRVWLITSACKPLGHAIALAALQSGESVAAGCTCEEIRADNGPLQELKTAASGSNRLAVVELDTRNIALCQSALAETVYAFRRIDVVLNCTSQCLWFPRSIVYWTPGADNDTAGVSSLRGHVGGVADDACIGAIRGDVFRSCEHDAVRSAIFEEATGRSYRECHGSNGTYGDPRVIRSLCERPCCGGI